MSNTKRLVKKGCVVIRDGNRVRPEIGKVFSFTADEAKQLNEATAGTLAPASEATTEESEGVAATTTTSSAESSQAKARGGKKAATANTSDAEAAAAESGDDDL